MLITQGRYSSYLDEYNKTVYYIDFDNYRLIFLNSFHYNEIHKITNNQLKWFENICKQSNKNKLLFLHSPAFPTGAHLGHCLDLYPKCRDDFWSIVDKYEIKLVFSSHEHNYSRRVVSGKMIFMKLFLEVLVKNSEINIIVRMEL